MVPPVDTSIFQPPPAPDDEDRELIEGLRNNARAYVETRAWASVVSEILLAYAFADKLGLFLVRLSEDFPGVDGSIEGDRERWVVVGDVPSMNFETEDFETPELALQLYCVFGQDWGDAVLTGRDLSESYPIPVAPTEQYARMLLSRVEFIRENIIPECRAQCAALADLQRIQNSSI